MDIENGGKGLNISLQVLDGILSHNGEMLSKTYSPKTDKNWDIFLNELNNCYSIKGFSNKLIPMTLEGCVMRISDVIAYVGRDVEDAITLKVIKRSDIPDEVAKVLGDSNDKIIDSLATDLIENSFEKPFLEFSDKTYNALAALKKFNYDNIYFNESVKGESHKIENMYQMLFDHYKDNFQNQTIRNDFFCIS
jgi:dGTPase